MSQSQIGASTPTIFNFRNHQVRVVTREGEPWFVASDVCAALGYLNTSKAIGDHLDEDEKGITNSYTLGGNQDLLIISESGLYALVLRSRKPEARKFAKWVTAEVLPAIRKTGGYGCVDTPFIPIMHLIVSLSGKITGMLKNGEDWRHTRLLLSWDGEDPVITNVPQDALVLTVPEIIKELRTNDYLSFSLRDLPDIIRACCDRLLQRFAA